MSDSTVETKKLPMAMNTGKKVLCPVCVKNGLKSTVRRGATTETCMAWDIYYDEGGVYHSDNPNSYTTVWYCSQGHEWIETYQYGESKFVVKNEDSK